MNIIKKTYLNIFLIFIFVFSISFMNINDSKIADAQDIPELHMIVFQGDIILGNGNNKTSSLDGYTLEAKIGNQVIGTTKIAKNLTGRYSGLEVGPNISLEGENITFWVGNEKAMETSIFGPLTPSGSYCKGCTWSLPLSRTVNLHFQQVPLPTPTPAPATVQPSFLTGSIIFGSVLSAPDGVNVIEAFIGEELVGTGEVSGSTFSITLDPGTELYTGKDVRFVIEGYESKTNYVFQPDQFKTDVKLFFPQYIPPTPTPTPAPLATAVPTFTPTPEPTRTPTPVPEPTPTYTPTPTPTPIAVSTSSDLVIEDSSDGGCNSRGGGPASVSLILLSLVPAYVLNRKRRIK